MMSIPFLLGFSPDRWGHAFQFMLEKKPGIQILDQMRVIQIVEADMNMAAKIIIAHKLMHRAESQGNLPDQQHGFRSNRSAIGAALLKCITYDFIHLTRQQAIVFNNDAKACFDRVIPLAVAIAMERQGLGCTAVEAFVDILRSMKYKVKTQLGISEEQFSNLLDILLGTLQGACWSTTTWTMTSAVLLANIEKQSPGITLYNPQQTISDKRAAEAFADDADLWLTFQGSFQEACAKMEKIAQYWEQSLFASGGALALNKCFWYGISWQWKDGIPSVATIEESPGTISLSSGYDNSKHNITRCEPGNGKCTLGVWISANGSQQHQYRLLIDKAVTFANNLAATHLTREEGLMAIRSIIKPALTYPLGATSLSYLECTNIDRRYTSIALSKIGLAGTTARAIIHGSPTLMGLGWDTLWVSQGLQHIQLLLGHIRAQDSIGRALQVAIDWTTLHTGIGGNIFQQDPSIYTYLDSNWIKSTWSFLHSASAHIEVDQQLIFTPQREHDQFLMSSFLTLTLSPKELRRLNACRLYLQVITLADITDGGGHFLMDHYLKGHKASDRRSKFD